MTETYNSVPTQSIDYTGQPAVNSEPVPHVYALNVRKQEQFYSEL